jgi:hypothetical protein
VGLIRFYFYDTNTHKEKAHRKNETVYLVSNREYFEYKIQTRSSVTYCMMVEIYSVSFRSLLKNGSQHFVLGTPRNSISGPH